MSKEARHALDAALRLPVAERATVITELLASIDGAPDADAEQAWASEFERRAERALRGESEGQDWSSMSPEIDVKRRDR